MRNMVLRFDYKSEKQNIGGLEYLCSLVWVSKNE